ncbi:MAG: PD40 domain-containing protein [Gemmatimonadetes bacterium]|nr:PD40 domain-containing protein [Gemmatimonadota bacterium]
MRLRSLLAVAAPATLALSAPAAHVAAQAPADTSWDITKARGKTREIDFTVSEGTWTSVDLSTDGKWVVFDLLSHVYRVPSSGGTAESLTQSSGVASNFHPRLSPDGKSIAFISDRKGQYNLWLMDADGANPRPVALDPTSRFAFPQWTADNQYIIVVKMTGFGSRSLVMFHRDGGTGVTLVKGDVGKVPYRTAISADGRYLYYDVYTARPTGFWGQDDVLKGTVQIHRYDLKSGVVRPITFGEAQQQDRATSGGAYAAEPSPDGRWLAFMRKVPNGVLEYKGQKFGPRSALWIRDLKLGGERLVMDPVEMDLAEESIPLNGSYPMYRWASDGKSIVIHQGGKIRRLDVASGAVSTIPFTARVQRTISEQVAVKNKLSDAPFDVRFVRWATTSPDGKTLAFQALGRIWLQSLPGGTPRRLTPATFEPFEFQPAWSPDGRTIAFASVDANNRGALWRVAASGGAPERLTREVGEYMNPAWTPDGREIVAVRGAGASARASTVSRNGWFDVFRMPSAGGEETDITQFEAGSFFGGAEMRPTVGNDGRVYFAAAKMIAPGADRPVTGVEVLSLRLDGTDKKVHANVKDSDDAAVSPDGRWVAFTQGSNTYLSPLPPGGAGDQAPLLAKAGGAFSATPLTTEGGLYPRWRSANVVDFASANRVYSHDASARRTDTIAVKLTAPRAIAQGSIALTGARIVTLDNKRVINSGTIVVKAGRITCVGSCSTSGVDKVVNASGKTIIPGWVDMHAHHHREHLAMMPKGNFESAIYLAYGVTTTSDPSTSSVAAFPTAELIEAGEMVGPRAFSVAEALTNGDNAHTNDVTSRDIAVTELKRRMSWGAVLLKQYLQPQRQQRQWAVDAARQLGLRVTAEGSDDLNHKLGMIMDGHNGGEHPTVQAPLYADFTTFLGKSKYFYSHTPLVSGYAGWNEEYFWQESPVWQDAKQGKWVPWRQLIPHTRRFIMRPETDYSKDIMSQQVADIIAAGGYSAVGSHGQQAGLGSHWDVWMAAKANGPMTALEIASMHGAMFLGMEADIGSISVGKLADLMVLNTNPLENIRNTADIRYVMKAGTLYDAMSLDEIWPKAKPYGDNYWYVPQMYEKSVKAVGTYDRK